MNKPYRFFIDMDGTVARFYERANCLEEMLKPGFFLSLRPYQCVIAALKCLPAENAYILSAAPTSVAQAVFAEKKAWVQAHTGDWQLPDDHFLFMVVGESKPAIVCERLALTGLSKTDILLDDYNYHLEAWERAGGTGIKLVNEINDGGQRGPKWNGFRIRHDSDAASIRHQIEKIILATLEEL